MDELFPDGGFVRLQSRGNRNKYVHADGDWEGVSLRPLGVGTAASLEAVWRVEHLAANQVQEQEHLAANQEQEQEQEQEVIFLQLQNAAYGRYLSFSTLPARPGHRGYRAVQSDRFEPPDDALHAYLLWWRVERVRPNQDSFRLRCTDSNFDLRANGRHRRWNTGVTIDENRLRRLTTMMQWTAHVVPASPVPLPLPVAPPQPQQGGRRGLLFWRRTGNSGPGVHQHPVRTIRHVRASDEGNFDQNHHNWPSFDIDDHSVFHLRTQLGQLQHDWNEDMDMSAYTLCMRPGSHGRLMPLVTDLPRSLDPIYIVVFRTGTSAAATLVYPQIAAPAQ